MALRRRSQRAPAPVPVPFDALRDSYERVPYPGAAFPQTHPDRLATISALFGGRPAPVETCRVLELGCGDGGNVLPMAHALPQARFTGIDLSPSAIGRASRTADVLGLSNVDLVAGDLAAQDAGSLGRFDVVIAHGVFSWVPDPVRDALLALTRACLEREGVAFLSFNALPGGHLRRVVRDAMQWHGRHAGTPDERLAAARDMAHRLAMRVGAEGPLRRQVDHALSRDDAGLLHDELADPSDAFHVADVAARAAGHGLRFLAEADLHDGIDGVAPELGTELEALAADRLEREQALDLLTLRAFRQAVLVRADARAGGAPRPDGVPGLRAAAQLTASPAGKGATRFETPRGAAVTTDQPDLRGALRTLGERWPASVPIAELGLGPALASAVLAAHLRGVVELRTWEPRAATHVSLRPAASAVARLQAETGQQVTTMRHTTVALDDQARRLVGLCDGSRDLPALGEALGDRDGLRGQLERLAALALLEA